MFVTSFLCLLRRILRVFMFFLAVSATLWSFSNVLGRKITRAPSGLMNHILDNLYYRCYQKDELGAFKSCGPANTINYPDVPCIDSPKIDECLAMLSGVT